MYTDKFTIREQNEKLILETITNNPNISRTTISQKTGLNKTTVSEIVKELISKNLIHEIGIGSASSLGGRKPILLKLNKKAGISLSLDIGNDYISHILTYISGEIIKKDKSYFNNISKKTVIRLVQNLVLQYENIYNKTTYGLVGVTIAIHGNVYENQILFTPYYDLDQVNLHDELSTLIGVPIFIENEANLTAIAEMSSSKKYQNLVSVSIHSGIGAGIIIDGQLYLGQHGKSGEIGHTILYPDGLSCPCGNNGCLEQYCSEKAILRQFSATQKNSNISIKEFIEEYLNNNKDAVNILNKTVKYISIGINNIITLFAPEIIYINSNLTANIPKLTYLIQEELKNTFSIHTPVKNSTFPNNAILYGANVYNIKNFLKINSMLIQNIK